MDCKIATENRDGRRNGSNSGVVARLGSGAADPLEVGNPFVGHPMRVGKETTFLTSMMESNRSTRRVQLDPLRHRFHHKAALILTGLTVALLGTLSLVFGGQYETEGTSSSSRWLEDQAGDNFADDGDGDYSDYSCRYIYEQVPDAGYQQCQFARTCNGGDGVWAPFVFCKYHFFSVYTLFVFLTPIMIVWMVTLFRLLGSTAEDFFSPSLEMFSVKLGLPPRFAGVTLLALGNGAADVSATMSAIVSDVENGYKLSLGALTGAAMLVGGVVAGIVVIVADGVPCRGALVRDVTALFITICVVWGKLSTGTIGPGTISLFLSLYGLFVCIVFVADVYHRAVVLPRLRALEAQANGEAGEHVTHPSILSQFITSISNYDNPCGEDTTVDAPEAGAFGVSSELNDIQASQGAALEQSDAPIVLHGQHGLLHGDGQGVSTPTATDADGGGVYTLIEEQQMCIEPGSGGFSAANWSGAFYDGKKDVEKDISQSWEDIAYNGDLSTTERIMLTCEFPFTILRKLTVPIPCDGFYNRGLIALSIMFSPLWFAYYIWVGHEINLLSKDSIVYFLFFWGFTAVAAFMVLRHAPGGEGSMAMSVAAPIALYGFIIAATWIDFIADHLVSLLDFVGIVLHIPGSIMGLTVLAWGNSMGDLSANMTMARKGLANMAMTACFAGPVFNILLGLGFGFSGLATKTGNSESAVSLSAPINTGFIFVFLNCITILVTGTVIGRGRIETYYGYIAVGLYLVYLVASIWLEFTTNDDDE